MPLGSRRGRPSWCADREAKAQADAQKAQEPAAGSARKRAQVGVETADASSAPAAAAASGVALETPIFFNRARCASRRR